MKIGSVGRDRSGCSKSYLLGEVQSSSSDSGDIQIFVEKIQVESSDLKIERRRVVQGRDGGGRDSTRWIVSWQLEV